MYINNEVNLEVNKLNQFVNKYIDFKIYINFKIIYIFKLQLYFKLSNINYISVLYHVNLFSHISYKTVQDYNNIYLLHIFLHYSSLCPTFFQYNFNNLYSSL